jgi:hypothetical protein
MSTSLDQKFTADAAQVEAVFEKMKRHNQDLLTQLQKLKTETKQGHDQANKGEKDRSSFLQGTIGDVTKLVAGYFSVNAAVGMITKSFQHAAEQMEKANKQAEDINNKVIAAGVATRDLQNADRIKAFAQTAAAQGLATQDDALTIYREASQAHPGASFERKQQIAMALLPQRAILNDDELGDYAKVAGKNAKLFGDGTAASEIADITLAMREMAGMRFNELKDRDFDKGAYKLGASGAMSKEEGLAFAVSAVVNNQEAGIIERFANKIFDTMDTKQLQPGMTAAQRRETRLENQYAKMTPAQRYEALKSDDSMARAVLDSDYLNFKQLQQDVPRITANLQAAAAPGDYSGARLKEAGTQAVVQERMARNRLAAQGSDAIGEQEIRAQAIARAVQFVNQSVDKNDPIGPDWAYKINAAQLDYQTFNLAPQDIAEKALTKSLGTGLTQEQQDAFIAQERDLITKQLEAAKAMKDAADALKSTPDAAKAVPAKPLDIRSNREGR